MHRASARVPLKSAAQTVETGRLGEYPASALLALAVLIPLSSFAGAALVTRELRGHCTMRVAIHFAHPAVRFFPVQPTGDLL